MRWDDGLEKNVVFFGFPLHSLRQEEKELAVQPANRQFYQTVRIVNTL